MFKVSRFEVLRKSDFKSDSGSLNQGGAKCLPDAYAASKLFNVITRSVNGTQKHAKTSKTVQILLYLFYTQSFKKFSVWSGGL